MQIGLIIAYLAGCFDGAELERNTIVWQALPLEL